MQILTSNPCTSGCVHKSKYFWSFPWWVSKPLVSWPSICLKIARIWPSITLLECYIRNPFDTLKGEEFKSKKTIVHCCRSLIILESAFLCPLEHFVFFPSLPFSCEISIERWRIEVVEAQVEELVSPIRRCVDRGCHYCNLCFILIEISFSIQ